ncbi:hypothetical protein OS493_027989 [Desmophyllum pertusum]|uniref:Kinesin light chain n=1 Tax=Desmophyllum pertusum TaxID=174260 RepID=A0A9W9YAY0_9CNID|nr:hypothetical protein OS493_027989 [Desmophyllum pertusum]
MQVALLSASLTTINLELLQNLSKKFICKNSASVAILTFREQKANILEALKNSFEDTSDVDQKGLDVASSTEVLDFLAKVLTPPKECTKLYRKCCDIAKTSGDKKRYADSLNSLGFRRLCDVSHSKHDREGSRVTLGMFQEAYDIRRTLPRGGTESVRRMRTPSGDEEKGRALIKKGISMRMDLGVALYVAAGHCDLGNTYRLCGDHQTAIDIWLMNTLPVYKQELGDHPWTASILHYIGDSYKALAIGNSEHGYAEQAEMYFREALELRRRLLGVHQDTARSHVFLSDVLVIRGEFKSALEELEKALEIQKDVLGPQHKITSDTLDKITKCAGETGCKEEAKERRKEMSE